VRVTDFGIAVKGVAAKNTRGRHTVLATRPVGYTPAYAAPEQRAGAKAKWATDQYALALVFCSMLEGVEFTEPYEPRRFARLTTRQNDALLRALSEDTDDRFESCAAFARALDASRAT
jgi:serine/threonine protein kinase